MGRQLCQEAGGAGGRVRDARGGEGVLRTEPKGKGLPLCPQGPAAVRCSEAVQAGGGGRGGGAEGAELSITEGDAPRVEAGGRSPLLLGGPLRDALLLLPPPCPGSALASSLESWFPRSRQRPVCSPVVRPEASGVGASLGSSSGCFPGRPTPRPLLSAVLSRVEAKGWLDAHSTRSSSFSVASILDKFPILHKDFTIGHTTHFLHQ